MADRSVKHPFQSIISGRAQGTVYLYIACQETLFQLDAQSGAIATTWQADPKCSILLLALSDDESHIAAATADDKAIHIFKCLGLKRKAQKLMPKRPCAITFTQDGSHVLCADKFGDVYAVPLELASTAEAPAEAGPSRGEPFREKFKPSATELTVHSKRNLRSLQNQLATAERILHQQPKRHLANGAELAFTEEPQFGHVSMLTDILTTELVDSLSKRGGSLPSSTARPGRRLIITADRDEHIRISRGLPQAHIIEGFCLGHTQFISRMCLLREDILVSGGGDDFLCVWSLKDYSLLHKVPVCGLVAQAPGASEEAAKRLSIAITGLLSLREAEYAYKVFCTIEGVAGVIEINFRASRNEKEPALAWEAKMHRLEGNALAMTAVGQDVLICLDNVHAANSTVEKGSNEAPRMHALYGSPMARQLVESTQALGSSLDASDVRQLSRVLYTTENMRKRELDEDGDE